MERSDIAMTDNIKYAMKIHEKGDSELNNRCIEIYDYLISKDVDMNMIVELQSINTELTIRNFTKSLGLS